MPGRQISGIEGRERPPCHDALVAAPPPVERRGGRAMEGEGVRPQRAARPHHGGHEGLQGSRSFWRRLEIRGPLRGASCKPSAPFAGRTARPMRPVHRMLGAASGCTGATTVPGINPLWHLPPTFPSAALATAGIAGADPALASFRPGSRTLPLPAGI